MLFPCSLKFSKMSIFGHYYCRTQKQEGISAPKAPDTCMYMLYFFLIKGTKKEKPDDNFLLQEVGITKVTEKILGC